MNSFTTSLKLLEVDNLQVKKRNAQSFAVLKMGLLETWILFIMGKKPTVCIYMYLQYPNACISPDLQKTRFRVANLECIPRNDQAFHIHLALLQYLSSTTPWWTSKSQINTRSTSSSWKHQQPPEKTATNSQSKHIISINIVQLQTQVLPSYKKGWQMQQQHWFFV